MYAFDLSSSGSGPANRSTCMSMTSINPQEYDSGLVKIADLPNSTINYFDVTVNLTRVRNPSTYLGNQFPKCIAEGRSLLLEGGSALVEKIGPISRMFSFERSGAAIYLRRKQSVRDSGNQGFWNPNNAIYFNNGGWRTGFTYGGSPNAWPAFQIEVKGPGGQLDKKRDGSNRCSLTDPTNYSSIWRGSITIVPGYIDP